MNSNKKAKARKAALAAAQAKKTAQAKQILTVGVGIGMLFIGLGLGVTVRTAFAANTCGGSQKDLAAYLLESQGQGATVLKTAREGRVQAVLYEREDLGLCTAVFEQRLFGLRWAYDGMESAPETGLGMTGSWQAGGFLRGTQCEAVVYGDNRTGAVDSYTVTDADGVGRSDLEADYILDVYVLDGAEQLPRILVQYGPDGSVLSEEG